MSHALQKENLRFSVTVVFGSAAVRSYFDGERDDEVLCTIGRVKTYFFETRSEMRAFMIGVEQSTGFHDSLFLEEYH
jgi:hypothetical protein